MRKYLALIADGARARILSLERAEGERTARLVERSDLVNPEHELQMRERFTGQRSESRGRVLGQWYGLDDHRLRQDEEHERKFAAHAVHEAARIAEETRATDLVIVAAPHMLGFIRSEGAKVFKRHLEIHGASSSIARLSISRLQAHLERKELIPQRPALR
jgi:protein required for attachment to host cells